MPPNPSQFGTVDRKVIGFPLDRENSAVMIKPGELVDVVEISPLNLVDVRIYNQLLANAWPKIAGGGVHRILKSDLKGSHNGNDRLQDSIRTLMTAIAEVRVVKEGLPARLQVQLLGGNVRHEAADGYFYYRFPSELLEIFKESEVFARLKTRIMYAFTSKYALRLYEIIQKRVNLEYKQHEDFDVEELRGMLGVPEEKLPRFSDFNKHALKPALEEVNFLGEYAIGVKPLKKGRRVTAIRLAWVEKDSDGKLAAWDELERPRLGRRARMRGDIERINSTL